MSENKEELKNEEVVVEEVKKEETKKEDKKVTKTEEVAKDIKNEATETVKQVKEKMKDVDIKEEAKATKGFVSKFIKDPIGETEEICKDNESKNFKTALVLIIIWAAACFIWGISTTSDYLKFEKNLMNVVKTTLAPVVAICGLSISAFITTRKGENKKSLITVITAVTTAKIPVILADIVDLLRLISSEASKLTNRVDHLATALSMVILFFAIKSLSSKEDNKSAFVSFALTYGIYMIISILVSFLGIGIY